MRFFALRVTVEPKIPGAVIPRRVFTQPGSFTSFPPSRCVPKSGHSANARVFYEYTSLDAIIEKYGFSEGDLDDITKVRAIICEAANGPPPFSSDVVSTCGDGNCVNPEHLEWSLI